MVPVVNAPHTIGLHEYRPIGGPAAGCLVLAFKVLLGLPLFQIVVWLVRSQRPATESRVQFSTAGDVSQTGHDRADEVGDLTHLSPAVAEG